LFSQSHIPAHQTAQPVDCAAEDAKRVLRDEAVLPLVMPELFQNVPILKPTKAGSGGLCGWAVNVQIAGSDDAPCLLDGLGP
jgi:hypothetical protein